MKRKFTFLTAAFMLLAFLAVPLGMRGQTATQTIFSEISGNVNNDTHVSYTCYKGSASTAPGVYDDAIRLYQASSNSNTGGYVVIGVGDGYEITSATIQSTMATTTGYKLTDTDPGNTTPDKSTFNVNNHSLNADTDYTVSDISTQYITFACFGTTKSSRLYLCKISITYQATSGGQTYTITPQSNDPTFGTVTLSGNTITANPSSGYRVKAGDDGYTVTNGTATVMNNGDNTFTVTPSSDCTVQINFEAIPTHTANFSVNGAITSQTFAEGAAITFPTNIEDINGKKHVGWVATAIDGTTNTTPSFVTNATMGTTNVTYYAVFADVEAGIDTYEKLSSNSFDTDATYVIGATQASTNNTMWYFNSYSSNTANISWGGMTSDPENNSPIKFTLSGSASALYAQDESGNYLTGLETGKFRMSSSSTTVALTESGTILNSNNGSYYLRHNYNGGNGGLRWYNSNTGTSAYFYKVIPGVSYSNYCTTVSAATPSISAENVEINHNATNGNIYATINNYIAGTMEASTEANWISSFTYDQADEIFEVGFTASQNTAPSPRSANVTLTYNYGGAQPATKTVTVTQTAAPIATIAGVWDFANNVGTTSTQTTVQFNNWYVTAVKGSQLFVTDGNKGLVMYESEHGFSVGDKLNGTVQCNVLLYQSHYAEITGVTASMLTVTANQEVPVLNTTIDALDATNYGMAVNLGTLTYNGTNFVDGSSHTIKPYNNFSISDYPSLTTDAAYYVKGIFYIYYSTNSSTNQIAPRTAADFTIVPDTYSITIAAGLENNLITDPENEAEVGDVVEIAVVPPTNQVLETLTVTKAGGGTVAVSPEVSGLVTVYTFTMPADNVTISATFVDESSTVTLLYSVNGVDEEVMLYTTAGYALPTPAANQIPTGFDFAGWTLDESVSPIELLDSNYEPENNDILVAVFSREEGEVCNYQKITAVGDLTNGEYLIVYETDSKIHNGGLEDLNASNNYLNVQINNNIINGTNAINGATFTIASYGEGTFSILSASGKYIGKSGNSNGMDQSVSLTENKANSISFDEGDCNIVGTGGAHLRYNSSATTFRYYKSDTYEAQNAIQLYKQIVVLAGTTYYYTRVFVDETATAAITITGPSIIPAGSTLDMDGNELTSATAANLIIEDGGQLITTSSSVQATMKKTITGYADANERSGYYLIASPMTTTAYNNTAHTNLTGGTFGYDLFAYDAANELWLNFKDGGNGLSTLNAGQGYLYANGSDMDLLFIGALNTAIGDKENLPYVANNTLQSLYLAGNTLSHNETFYVLDGNLDKQTVNFLTINTTGDNFITTQANSFTADAMQGFFVQSNGDNRTLSTTDPSAKSRENKNDKASMLNIMVVNEGDVIDNAIVSFCNAPVLNKFYLNENSTHIYIPKGREDYAVLRSNGESEMPVNFKAAADGTYTISVEAENLDVNYLHLIDNKTGMDVDLLATPSYTFEGKRTDYASRFRLVFDTNAGNNEANEEFAFISDGDIIVNGTGTVQVIDILGRQMFSHEVNSAFRIQNSEFAPGVYVLRLVNGNNVKTQKIVIK